MSTPGTVARVTACSAAGKAAGFVVPLLVAAWFGAGIETDAFFFAYGVVLFIAGISGPVLDVVVPFVADARRRGDSPGPFLGGLLGAGTGLFTLGIAATLLILVPLVPRLSGFESSGLVLTRMLLVEIAPLALLLYWTNVLSGYLNARQEFAWPALSPAIRAAVNLGVLVILRHRWGIHALVIGYVAGEVVRLVVLAGVIAVRAPFRLVLSWHVDDSQRTFARTTAYAVLAMVGVLGNQFVDTTMASWLGSGSVSVLHYAGTLYMIPMSLLGGGLMTVVLARWSEKFGPNPGAGFAEEMRHVSRTTLMATAAGALGFIAASGPLTALLLGHGILGAADVDTARRVWVAYLVGFPAQASAQLSTRALLVVHDTRALARGAAWALGLNAIGNGVLMGAFGSVGIACATSATAVFSAWYLRRALQRALVARPS